jgi:hypothetical protein
LWGCLILVVGATLSDSVHYKPHVVNHRGLSCTDSCWLGAQYGFAENIWETVAQILDIRIYFGEKVKRSAGL